MVSYTCHDSVGIKCEAVGSSDAYGVAVRILGTGGVSLPIPRAGQRR
jgi:hypothetical protein